jgi:FAD synthase
MREWVNGSADSGLPPDVNATVVTVGTFDGVHRGHRDVLDRSSPAERRWGVGPCSSPSSLIRSRS